MDFLRGSNLAHGELKESGKKKKSIKHAKIYILLKSAEKEINNSLLCLHFKNIKQRNR